MKINICSPYASGQVEIIAVLDCWRTSCYLLQAGACSSTQGTTSSFSDHAFFKGKIKCQKFCYFSSVCEITHHKLQT